MVGVINHLWGGAHKPRKSPLTLVGRCIGELQLIKLLPSYRVAAIRSEKLSHEQSGSPVESESCVSETGNRSTL